MAGVAITINMGAARRELARMILWARNPRPLLARIGQHAVARTKQRFEQRGPGWPAIHPYFEELKRRTKGKTGCPLVFSGHLQQSITYEVIEPDGVRVGSPMIYAATQQFGSDDTRTFYLHIQPGYESGVRGKRIERDEAGRILGKVRISQATFEEKMLGTEREFKTLGKYLSGGIKRQLISINVRPRPFLVEPDAAELDLITRMIERHLFFGGAA